HLAWAILAGAAGGLSLGIFYRALAQGEIGLAAPLAALLSAVIPAAFGIMIQGRPQALTISGLLLALLAIWLISRPEHGIRPEGLGLAVVSGFGFALFYIFMERAGSGSALWLATASRSSALLVSSAITLVGRKFSPSYPLGFALALLSGPIDVTGTVLFVRAEQTGPLASAVVLASLYPIVTVLLARVILKERFSLWKAIGVVAAVAAVPMIVAR
ncbi:MAG: EamA family transporter, partial [Acidobacteria bacterium]|nr:EamA family transporter [Acidobacteriota bacterium]